MPSIAVIGTGYWGKNLVRNFYQLKSLSLACDSNEDTLEQVRVQYKGIKTCSELKEALIRDDIQAIAIATPAETHFNIAKKALHASKHVFVEKPLVLYEDEGVELIDLAKARNLVLMVGHLLQYHPVFVRLKDLASSGELGRINYIYSNRLNLGKIRREENILWSFAPHDISMILSLAGEDPEHVYATGGNYLHQKIADVTTTHMTFPSELRAHIFVSWLHPFKEQKLIVVGDKKMAVFDDTQPWEEKLLLYPHQINWQNNAPVPVKGEPEKLDIPESKPLREECLHFLDCISNNKHPWTDGHEGLRVLKVLNTTQRSLDGRSLPIEPKKEEDHVSPYGSVADKSSDVFVHKTSVIDKGSEIGAGTKIWHFSHILNDSKIGKNCNIGQNVVVGPNVAIGDYCKIQNNVSIFKGVTLENGVFCGPSMVFTNVYNPRAEINRMAQVRPTLIKKGATLGANCTIICGITVGKYAFVGAGAVVNRDIPDNALVVGNPARQIGWICSCGVSLKDHLVCKECNRKFEVKDGQLIELSIKGWNCNK